MFRKTILIFGICSMLLVPGCGQKEKTAEEPAISAPVTETKSEDKPRGEDINAFLNGENRALIDEFSN